MAKNDKGLSKNARVGTRGKQTVRLYKGAKVEPIQIRFMSGKKTMIGVKDAGNGSLLKDESGSFLSWNSISSLLTIQN